MANSRRVLSISEVFLIVFANNAKEETDRTCQDTGTWTVDPALQVRVSCVSILVPGSGCGFDGSVPLFSVTQTSTELSKCEHQHANREDKQRQNMGLRFNE